MKYIIFLEGLFLMIVGYYLKDVPATNGAVSVCCGAILMTLFLLKD